MIKFKSKLWDLLAVAGIGLIVFLLYLANFRGNFWISGWDNLHPEFNFASNLGRAIFSAWQEYQGLGLPAGHGHATELFREIILWLVNIFLPTIDVRKIYLLAVLFSGSLGVYFFIRNVLLSKIHYELRVILSFIAASLYLLNLVTLQIFYIPYEAFVAYFAFLPWMVYSIYIFMHHPSKKNFLIFLLIQLLGTWQFYIPTLFVVYLPIAFLVPLSIALQNDFRKSWRIFAVCLLGIIIVNLYWLLPFGYYTLTNLGSQQAAYVDLLYTKDAYTANANFGNLQNAALLKSFLFDNVTFTNNQGFSYMMGQWRNYANQWYFLLIGYSIFTISIVGLIQAIRKKKHLILALLFVLYFAFVAIQTFPFNLINNLLRGSPLLYEVFRNPFTKFGNSVLFFMIIFFIYGLLQIIEAIQANQIKRIENKIIVPLATLFAFLVLINIYIFPFWKGNFIYPPMKAEIPNEYFQTFNYFQTQPNGRIANLPQFTADGWDYYKWGYQGSGFIWYGINQPILDRAFDVWSGYDENYYWEISQAIYSQNLPLFEKILDKYQINWLLVDGNITTPGNPSILYTDQIGAMLKQSNKISPVKQFGNIKIYKVNLTDNPQDFVFTTNVLPNIKPSFTWNDNDQAYIDFGNYMSKTYAQNNTNALYPFRSLFTGRDQKDIEFDLKEETNDFILEAKIPKEFYNSTLLIPAVSKEEATQIDKNNLAKTTTKNPVVLINNTPLKFNPDTTNSLFLKLNQNNNYTLEVKLPKIYGYYGNPAITSSNLNNIKPADCNQFNQGSFSVNKTNDGQGLLQLISTHSNNCLNFNLPTLTQNLAYLLSVPAKNIEGKSLLVSISNSTSQRDDITTYLPEAKNFVTSYLIIPPKQKYGLGYNIHLDNISLDNNTTENELGEVKINPIPYNFLSSIKLINGNITQATGPSTISVTHDTPYYYKIIFDGIISQNQSLILSQAFDRGWHAYFVTDGNVLSKTFPFLFGKEVKNHILVNNWENGWILDKNEQDQNLAIIYLPQYFEYLGLIMLFITFIAPILAILASKMHRKRALKVDL